MELFEESSARRKELQKQGIIPEWYTTQGLLLFERNYAYEDETVKEAFERVANTLSKHYTVDVDLAQSKFFDIMWKGFLSPATPVLANVGTGRGLPVSCSGQCIEDSVEGFYEAYTENAILSKNGFGTSSYLGDIRPRGSDVSTGGKADGVVAVFDSQMDVVRKISQGSRRGAWAGYLPVDHDDFYELAGYVLKNRGDANVGWIFTDEFIDRLKVGEEDAVARWNEILYIRCKTGKGYFWKPDTANKLAPQAIKNCGIPIKAAQLCNEISLPSDSEYSYSCVLSSLNLAHWDDFEEDTIFWSTIFLDCVCQEFIDRAKENSKWLSKVIHFTEDFRAIGLGVLGLHTLFQEKGLAFEELRAHMLNTQIFKKIEEESTKASKHMAELFGEPKWCKGTGMRNATLTAIAPTMSSSILCGSVSQGIEPIVGNAYVQQTAAGDMIRYNPTFIKVAKKHGMYSQELLDDIAINHGGSVQHLGWLGPTEKLVFLTAYEINQEAIIRLASRRQQFIDQGQSLNLFVPEDEDEGYIAELHKQILLDPYLKGAYYLRTKRGVSASKGECMACHA